MLELHIDQQRLWDEEHEVFIPIKEQTLRLEHSLLSLSKWESKWHVPFLSKNEKTREQLLDYVRCMTVTQNVDENTYYALSKKNFDEINDYIGNPMSATTFQVAGEGHGQQKPNRETMTSELIYYYMSAYSIPYECEKWHLNRLLNLIRIASIKNSSPKYRSKKDVMSQNARLNAARRARLGTKG